MGCVNTRQVNVTEEDCKPQLSIPNVFTPNGDGVNDVLKFRQIEKCFDVDILIVDRKGSHVLHEKVRDPDDFSWNGCYKNGSRKLPDGPYFYMVSYKDAYGKKKVQSGSITILGTAE
ncbi:MAG: gliding motility-associated C-terminal domain-containing protein [Bacteroides sp.]|nr:gliding motility-associated C-terminal domain-containing protein [Bacteroides sp.]